MGEEIVKTKLDVKQKEEPDIKSNKEHKQDVKPNIELKHDVKMIRPNLIRIRSPMRKKRLLWYWELQLSLQYGGCSNGLSSPRLCHEICVDQNSNTCDKCPQVLRQPTNHFLVLFKIHEIIDPIIPGRDNNALSANFPSSCNRAFNLFFIHSLAPPFLSPPLVPPDLGVDGLGPPNRASVRTPRVIPKAVKIETIVIPCSLKRVFILSPSVPVSLSKNLRIDSLFR